MKSIIGSLLLVFSLNVAAGDDTAAEALHTLLNAFLAGASENDASMHDRFWAEDLVYTGSAGTRHGKAEIMNSLAGAADEAAGPVYSARNVDIRVFDDTAVITFRLVATDAEGEQTHYFNTGVFRHESDQWRAIAWQATKAAD